MDTFICSKTTEIYTHVSNKDIGMYMRNTADITPKWKDIRIADIMPNRSDICSTADIPKLYEITIL